MAGNIKGITIEFRGDTTNLDKALRQINKETSATNKELRSINNALKFNPKSADLWSQKQTVLNQKIAQTKEKLDVLKQAQAKMDASGIDKNSEEYRKLQREIIETESKLKTFEAELRKIGNANLKALSEQFKQMGEKLTEAGKNLTQKVTLPLTALGAVSAKKFAEVDKTMQLTNATMANTAEEADLLDKAMKSAASNSTFGMNEAAQATLNFARAGLTAEQAANALAPAMQLAAGEGGDLDTVSAGLVATLNGFGDSFENTATYANIFANACNNSALDINSMSEAMSVAAPIFSAAGYSVKDAALYMGIMANAGIDASTAANALKTGMARLVSPSKDAQKWMDKLDISITNADGSMKDSAQVQKELNEAFSGLSESEQIAAASAIFGKNQMSNWLALINTAPSSVDDLSDSLDNMNTVEEMSGAMMEGFGGSVEKLKSSLDVAATSLGQALAPAISKVVEWIQKLVDWFNNLSPRMQSIIAVIGIVAAALGPVLVILGTLISSIGTIIGVLGMVSAPMIGIVAAIAAVVAAGVLLYKNWDKIKAKAQELWNKFKTVFNGIKTTVTTIWNNIKAWLQRTIATIVSTAVAKITSFKTTITTAFNNIKTTIITVWTNIKTKVQEIIGIVVSTVVNKITALKNNITTTFNNIRTTIVTIFTNIKTKVIDVWTSIKVRIHEIITSIVSTVVGRITSLRASVTDRFNSIKNTIVNVWNTVKNKVASVVNSIKTKVSSVFGGLKATVTSIWSGIKNAITKPIQTAKATLQGIINKIKGFFPLKIGKLINFKIPKISIKTATKKVLGKEISYPTGFDVSWYAKGGIFTKPTLLAGNNGISGVGEAGAEAVLPLDRFWKELEQSNARTDELLARQNQILMMLLEETAKPKNFKVDNSWAGRFVNGMVR